MKTNNYAKQFIKEIIPVIAGILIALFINNWNEDRKERKYLQKVLLSVEKELAQTQEEILVNFPKQKRIIDTLDVYLNNSEVTLVDIVLRSEGVNISNIRINAWKAIASSKIELINYPIVSALADIEEGKETLKIKMERFLDFIYSNMQDTSVEKKERLKIMVADIMSTETSISEDIEKFKKINFN